MVTEMKLKGQKKGNEGLTLIESMIAAVVLALCGQSVAPP